MEFRILEGLPAEDVRRFLALARRRTFERDEVVFHHGDPADAVHLITKGRFARRVHSSLGHSAMLAVRGPGETFGELALVWTGMSRLVTVSALEPGETLSVAGATFRGLLGRHPELKDVLVRLLAERLLYADKRIVAAHFLDADARVRWTLLQLAPVYARHRQPGPPRRTGTRRCAPRARPRAGPRARGSTGARAWASSYLRS
jgi:CRP/FNR family cyclic AMP-dependent transcriptional regulator